MTFYELKAEKSKIFPVFFKDKLTEFKRLPIIIIVLC